MNDKYNEEYLHYLMNDLGLLSEYDLHEIGITEDEYNNPTEDVLLKIENYRDQKNRN